MKFSAIFEHPARSYQYIHFPLVISRIGVLTFSL